MAWDVAAGKLIWSKEHFRIFGLDPEKAELAYPAIMQMIHANDRSSVQEAFECAIREKTDFEWDCRVVRPDGTVRYVHSLGHPVLNERVDLTEYVGTIIDTTERKQAEASLREANDKVEMILDSITDKFYSVDKEWRFTRFDQQAEGQLRTLGRNPSNLLGKVLWDEFPHPVGEEMLRRATSERAMTTDEHYFAPLGEWIENRIYPSVDGGLTIFQRYITERKRAEEELHLAETELARVTRRTQSDDLLLG